MMESVKEPHLRIWCQKVTLLPDDSDFADKAFNYAILTSWSYIAGILTVNLMRLERHYSLPRNSKKDPLNAETLAKVRHKSDPVNYRGLGSRTDVKERGRLAELFYLQVENSLTAILSAINALYNSIYKMPIPILNYELQSRIAE